MTRLGRWLIAGTLALGGFAGTTFAKERGEEEHAHNKVTLDQLPAAARSTFQKEAQGGTIEELRRDKRNGKTIYEGEVVTNGKGTDLQVAEDGTLLKRSAPHDEATEPEHRAK
jgi:uncharacterized membrane protein YkoI